MAKSLRVPAMNQPLGRLARESCASRPSRPTVLEPPKPNHELGSQYCTGAAWAWAVRPPRQSAANTTAKPILLAKENMGGSLCCAEQERQRDAIGFRRS